METKKSDWPWLVFFLVLILASPLLEGGETYHTVVWLRLWVLGFGMFFLLGAIKPERLELTVPAGNWIAGLLWLLLTLSLFLTHYYYITVYWYANFLVYFLLFYLCLGVFARDCGKKLLTAVWMILIAAGLLESIWGIVDYFRIDRSVSMVSGSFFNPAYYAGYLSGLMSFPLAGSVFKIFAGKSRGRDFWVRVGLVAVSVFYLAAMIISASRAVIFAALPISLILLLRFRGKALLVLAVLVLGFLLIPNPLKTRMENLGRDPYAWDRLTIWKSSLRMIRHHPAGVGLGMYQYYYNRYAYPVRSVKIGRFGKDARFAHNSYLTLAAEASVAAPLLGLCWLGFLLRPLPGVFWRRKGEEKDWTLLLGFSGSLLALLAHGLVDDNLRQPPITILGAIDVAAIVFLLSGWRAGLVRKKEYPLMHGRFLRGFIFGSVLVLALILTFQTSIYGLTLWAGKIQDAEQRLNYLERLCRFPSGYAPLYFQTAVGCREFFKARRDPAFAEKAVGYFESAARLNPENFEYYYYWAEFLYMLGLDMKNQEILRIAEKTARLSLARSDKYPYSYLMLANIARLRGDASEEEKLLQAVLVLEPYYFVARLFLSELYAEEGKREEAVRELELLKSQKQEVERILEKESWRLNGFQKLLVQLPPGELERVEQRLKQMP